MAIISELVNKYKTLSVVGMAKNAGKTTTLNYLIEEAADEGINIGVTSTGRDGEVIDVVTGTDKPRVYLYPETLVSVPKDLFGRASAGLEILKMTKYHTSIGPVMICKVVDSGYVQIAGPVLTSQQQDLARDMLSLGAEIILIDGAIDRKAIASPKASDAIILATGAVLSRSIQKVAEETAHTVALYSISEIGDINTKSIFAKSDKIMTAGKKSVQELDIETALAASSVIDASINEETEYVYIPGALTDSTIANIHPKKFKNTKFVVKDPTKIFLNSDEWQKLRKKGFTVNVLEKINIAAISVNPVSPQGYAFEHKELTQAIEQVVPDIRIINVKMPI